MFLILSLFLAFAEPTYKAEISGNFIKVNGSKIVVSIDEVDEFINEMDFIDPSGAKTEAEKTWISLNNLEAEWISGKRYAYIRGKKVEFTIPQQFEVLRAKARAEAGLPALSMTETERRELEIAIASIKKKVAAKVDNALYEERFKPKTVVSKQGVSKALLGAKGGAPDLNIIALLIDGQVFIIRKQPGNTVVHYEPRTKKVTINTQTGTYCEPNNVPSGVLKAQIDRNVVEAAYVSANVLNSVVVVDSVFNNAFCEKPLFKDSFEGSAAGASQ